MGICVRYSSHEGKSELHAYNQGFSQGCVHMPPIDDGATYGSLACSHLNLALRVLQCNSTSPLGDLSGLTADNPRLKDVVESGHLWWILDEKTPFDDQLDISLWRNADQNENQATHEIEILQTIMRTARSMSKHTENLKMSDLVSRAS